jgi:hypothetical protein
MATGVPQMHPASVIFRRYLRFELIVLATLTLAACFRQATDETAGPVRPRYTGGAPWSIEGVRPGQPFEEVRRLFGEPSEIRGAGSVRTAVWNQRETTVSFNQAGVITEVMGSSVEGGGQVLFRGGADEREVTQILGPGEVRKSSRPQGSGVVSFGQVHTGTTLLYDNAGVRFEFPVFGEATGHFLARRIP